MTLIPTRISARSALLLAVLTFSSWLHPRPTQAQPEALADAEHGLLHLRLDLGAARRWRQEQVVDEPLKRSKPLLVVHLFSLDCPPCLEELPLLKEVFRDDLPDIDYALVLETLSVPRIREFLSKNGQRLPAVPLYLNTDGRLRGTSQLGIETVPITLLLDQNLVVRQAFVGSLKGRMAELSEALTGLVAALKRQPQSIGTALAGRSAFDSTKLIHRSVDLRSLAEPAARRGAGGRELFTPSRLQLLYLFGSGCKECGEAVDGRLRRMVQGWSGNKEVSFAILNCEAGTSSAAPSAARDNAVASLYHACRDSQLQAVWTRAQRPLTLLVDSRQVVRDAFIGPVSSSVGVAVRRLLAAPP